MSQHAAALLKVENLSVQFAVLRGLLWQRQVGAVQAVSNVSFDVQRGETLGVVGESGCGKSTMGRAVLQLLQPASGSVTFDGTELTALWQRGFRGPRWKPELVKLRQRMQMIFQDPYASLNPRMTVESIIAEPLKNFRVAHGHALREQVQELMHAVGMDPRYIRRYPHEFSGGQRQRIGIARALALKPELIVCDEPVSALDVSIQAQVLNLLKSLQRQHQLTYIFVAHDLAAVRHMCDRIMVMYLGRIVEIAPYQALYQTPQHPYTKALLSAVPRPNPKEEAQRTRVVLKGDVPSALNPPKGCAFHPRCALAQKRCTEEAPTLRTVDSGHQVACHLV